MIAGFIQSEKFGTRKSWKSGALPLKSFRTPTMVLTKTGDLISSLTSRRRELQFIGIPQELGKALA